MKLPASVANEVGPRTRIVGPKLRIIVTMPWAGSRRLSARGPRWEYPVYRCTSPKSMGLGDFSTRSKRVCSCSHCVTLKPGSGIAVHYRLLAPHLQQLADQGAALVGFTGSARAADLSHSWLTSGSIRPNRRAIRGYRAPFATRGSPKITANKLFRAAPRAWIASRRSAVRIRLAPLRSACTSALFLDQSLESSQLVGASVKF